MTKHIQNLLLFMILVICGCQNGCNNECDGYEVGTIAISPHFAPFNADPTFICDVPPGTGNNDWCSNKGANYILYLVNFQSLNPSRYVLYVSYQFSCEDFVYDEVWAPYLTAGTAHVGDC